MHDDRRPQHVHNGIAQFDVAGPQLDLLAPFSRDAFGWSVNARGPGYASIVTPEGSADGAIVEADEAGLTIGIVVPDLAHAIAVAVARGGSVTMPITDNG
jgi:predicted enzyme related to lactoylglutathione lyase